MKKWKKSLLFGLALVPVAAVGGWFVAWYQFDVYEAGTLEILIAQVGSLETVAWIAVAQTVAYAVVFGALGYLLADKIGLMRPFPLEKDALISTVGISILAGALFSLDYWTFGSALPAVRESILQGLTFRGVMASVLYGGVMEEVLLRLFFLSLIAFVLWKLFFRSRETVLSGVLTAANLLAALIFAAGHLPATVSMYGGLSFLLLLRCFLLNGSFGLLFGSLFRRCGIQYAMLSHALLHIVSKLIWVLFAR
ncbi:MAG: CPBP family glutamic-type intramembrane protease [Candidatus Faecousia sp.]|nr:CPBP family glutamic-type intramembrane protease [Candidatus Faecousia sp.]